MRLICFLVGVRGAGKTTLTSRLESREDFVILKPSTTRRPRESDQEYHFVEKWDESQYFWSISVGEYNYGMSKTELQKDCGDRICVTVFDPGSIAVLEDFRSKFDGNVFTVGLDTIASLEEQSDRVKKNPARLLNRQQFEEQVVVVRECDAVFSGDELAVEAGVVALFSAEKLRGGLLPRSTIEPLLKSNVLLRNSSGDVQPASYDLHLGDDVWCQGNFATLTDANPTLRIPPYSYAIVSAKELANLPSFIAARFDLKNSLFFSGVILSNGPQVDPGYRGALFCMLYNGSDKTIGVNRGTHFSTIEFHTTSGFDLGYREKYQGKEKLVDFMPVDALVSQGGRILERTEEKIDKIESSWNNWRGGMITIFAFVLSPLVLIYWNLLPFLGNADVVNDLSRDNKLLVAKLAHLQAEVLNLKSSLGQSQSGLSAVDGGSEVAGAVVKSATELPAFLEEIPPSEKEIAPSGAD